MTGQDNEKNVKRMTKNFRMTQLWHDDDIDMTRQWFKNNKTMMQDNT